MDNPTIALVHDTAGVRPWILQDLDRVGGRVREFETLYRDMLPVVYRYLALRAGPQAAEEITNDVFLAVARSYESGRRDVLKAAWVMAVTKNKLIDHWRRADRKRKFDELHEPRLEDLSEPSAEVAVLSSSSEALAALDELPVRYRVLLTLRYIDDLSVAQVARAVDISETAAESALARARKAFRNAYAGASQ